MRRATARSSKRKPRNPTQTMIVKKAPRIFPGRLLALWRLALRHHSNGAMGTMVGCCGRDGAGGGGGAAAGDGVVDRGGDGDASAVASPKPAGGAATRGATGG